MSDAAPIEPTFEEALRDLDRIVQDLESGQTGLEESLSLYERGVHLIRSCQAKLRSAEQRILLLTEVDAEGKAVTQPFQHSATSEAAKPDPKSRIKKTGESEKLF
jgi:exodeoxyribonuclease VII small subunit